MAARSGRDRRIGAGATCLTARGASAASTFGVWFAAFTRALLLKLLLPDEHRSSCPSLPKRCCFASLRVYATACRSLRVSLRQLTSRTLCSPLAPLHGLSSPPAPPQPSASRLGPAAGALLGSQRSLGPPRPPHTRRSRAEARPPRCLPGAASPLYPSVGSVGRPHAPLAVTSEAKLSGEPANPEPEVAG